MWPGTARRQGRGARSREAHGLQAALAASEPRASAQASQPPGPVVLALTPTGVTRLVLPTSAGDAKRQPEGGERTRVHRGQGLRVELAARCVTGTRRRPAEAASSPETPQAATALSQVQPQQVCVPARATGGAGDAGWRESQAPAPLFASSAPPSLGPHSIIHKVGDAPASTPRAVTGTGAQGDVSAGPAGAGWI